MAAAAAMAVALEAVAMPASAAEDLEAMRAASAAEDLAAMWAASAVAALSPSTGDSSADLDLAAGTSVAGLLSAGSASPEVAASAMAASAMAAGFLSAVAGTAGIIATGPIIGARGATSAVAGGRCGGPFCATAK
jgi:hypothetical protein